MSNIVINQCRNFVKNDFPKCTLWIFYWNVNMEIFIHINLVLFVRLTCQFFSFFPKYWLNWSKTFYFFILFVNHKFDTLALFLRWGVESFCILGSISYSILSTVFQMCCDGSEAFHIWTAWFASTSRPWSMQLDILGQCRHGPQISTQIDNWMSPLWRRF